jgi:pimeloyl-ACP methyl ester carboxylesterase
MAILQLIILIGAISVCAGLLLYRPIPDKTLGSRPNPARDYPEAERRISALREREGTQLIPGARLQFMTHGIRTEQAIVFVHGYTNCPKQFVKLGERFFELGYNVLIGDLPHHGLPDRMTNEQTQLKAEELTAYADEMADIAQGLGKRVTFAGLSCGGVVSAWAWAYREDVMSAALMAPAFGLKMIPGWLTVPAVNLFSILPNFYGWFNPVDKIQGTPEHTYPRFSTRALVQIIRLGLAAKRRADRSIQAGKEMIIVTNPNDWAVNNNLTNRYVQVWRQLGASITVRQFDAAWKLDHDFIEPAQPNQPIERTYPLLVEWITRMNEPPRGKPRGIRVRNPQELRSKPRILHLL